MNRLILLLFLSFIVNSLIAQDLPLNPATGLVSISQSIISKDVSQRDFKSILQKWQNYLSQKATVEKIFSVNAKNETLSLSINNYFFHSSAEVQKDLFTNKIELKYTGYNRTPLFKEATSLNATSGIVTFNIIYSYKGNQFNFEFTNFEYSGFGTGGKFEDKKPFKPFAVGILAQNKKIWQAIKEEYYNRAMLLATNLNQYISQYSESVQTNTKSVNHSATTTQSAITYDSYQKIKTGMSYNEVKSILTNEGKEISSNVLQSNGKPITYQTFVWYESESNKAKSIFISFTDDKVSSKSQTNL
jgi:hypothetical protein